MDSFRMFRAFVLSVADLLSVPTQQDITFSGRTVRLDYRFISAYAGDNEDTLMLHIPGSMSPWNWAMMVPFWCAYLLGYASVVVSPPGEGWSSPADEMFYKSKNALQNLAHLYLRLAISLGYTELILVAHSTNSTQVVTEMAILAKEYGMQVKAIVLQAPSGLKKMYNPLGLLIRFSLSGWLLRQLKGKQPGLLNFFQQFFSQPIMQQFNRAKHLSKMWHELKNAGSGEFPQRLKHVQCGVFVLFAQYDFVHPFRSPFGKFRYRVAQESVEPERLWLAKLPDKLHNPTLLGSDPLEVALILRDLFRQAGLN